MTIYNKMILLITLIQLNVTYSVYVLGMPSKMPINPTFIDDDFTTAKFSKANRMHDPFSILMLASPHSPPSQQNLWEQYNLNNMNELKSYLNLLNTDAYILRKLMMHNAILKQLSLDSSHGYENAQQKIKKNFDEIDKTAASFSTLNQLL